MRSTTHALETGPQPIRGHTETGMHWLWDRTVRNFSARERDARVQHEKPLLQQHHPRTNHYSSASRSSNGGSSSRPSLSPRQRPAEYDLESQAGTETDASTLLDESGAVDNEKATLVSGEEENKEEETTTSSSRISARIVSDAIIGLSDGLTVPFALTAGLSALGDTRVVIFAGMAELTAGAISMGLGGYLGAKSEEESYYATLRSTEIMVTASPAIALSQIRNLLATYGLPASLRNDVAVHLHRTPEQLVPFLMAFEHHSPEPEASRAVQCALTIAGGYFAGGFLPLLPYFIVPADAVTLALYWSLAVMAVSLFVFGYGKTCFVTGWRGGENRAAGIRGGLQMVVVGGFAAGAAMGLVRLFDLWQASG